MKKNCKTIIVLLWLISGKSFAQCATPSVVPYFENFQSITANNQLPPCWTVSGSSCATYTGSSNNFADFVSSTTGNSYFYSNGIQLQAGITYSMSLLYSFVFYNYIDPWTNFSTLLGSSQNTTGLVPVISVTYPSTSGLFSALGNTFVVPSTGIYYTAIRITNNGSTNNVHFSWDDLSITIPCTGGYNQPPINISASQPTICAGSLLSLTAGGADNYTWNTGDTTATINDAPTQDIFYTASGTSTLTGCSATTSVYITVNPAPDVTIAAELPIGLPTPVICAGTPFNLTALGAPIILWSTGQQVPAISVSRTVTTTYTVIGTNSYSCSTMATEEILVNSLPVISILISDTILCSGQAVTLTATGANSYTWNFNPGLSFSGTVVVTPTASSVYSVSGTDQYNCIGKASSVFNVVSCTGLETITKLSDAPKIFPNPFHETFTIEANGLELKRIEITDVLGKIVFTAPDAGITTIINLSNLASGVYQARLSSGSTINYLKVIKD